MKKLSLIIPAHNEIELLPRLLDTVDLAREKFQGGSDAIEVVVADNASTDGTGELAASRGCVVVPVERRLIAAVRNSGARHARGEILCFVDADTRIEPETFNAIAAALDRSDIIAGSTGGRLERMSVGIGLTYGAVFPLLVLFNIDTGVVFCRRADFEAIGATVLANAEFTIRVDLGRGAATEEIWTSDLSYEYVRINAEYRT